MARRPLVPRNFPAHHEVDDLTHGGFGCVYGVNVFAVADDGDAVGDGFELIHAMRNVDDTSFFVGEVPDEIVQGSNFGIIESCRGLIHDQDT